MTFADALRVLRAKRRYACPQLREGLGWRMLSAPPGWLSSQPLTPWYATMEDAAIKAAEDADMNVPVEKPRDYIRS